MPSVDRFDVQPGSEREVDARFAELEGAERDDDSDPDSSRFVISRPDERTEPEGRRILLSRVFLDVAEFRIETDSTERADGMRQRVKAACGSRVRHLRRKATDQKTFDLRRPDGPPKPPLL